MAVEYDRTKLSTADMLKAKATLKYNGKVPTYMVIVDLPIPPGFSVDGGEFAEWVTAKKIQKFSDPHTKKCPECGGAVEQMISAPAVQFKGSGWYVTWYEALSLTGRKDEPLPRERVLRPGERRRTSAHGENEETPAPFPTIGC